MGGVVAHTAHSLALHLCKKSYQVAKSSSGSLQVEVDTQSYRYTLDRTQKLRSPSLTTAFCSLIQWVPASAFFLTPRQCSSRAFGSISARLCSFTWHGRFAFGCMDESRDFDGCGRSSWQVLCQREHRQMATCAHGSSSTSSTSSDGSNGCGRLGSNTFDGRWLQSAS